MVRAEGIVNQRDSPKDGKAKKATTGTHCDIITADATGSHGARPHLLILNELTHINDAEFPSTLMDNASKVPHGVVVVVTNAGHTDTWQEVWRQNAIDGDRWYFSAYTQPAPWLDTAEMREAKKSQFARPLRRGYGKAGGARLSRERSAKATSPQR